MIKKILIFIIGILAGLLLITQWQNYQRIAKEARGQRFDINREITLLISNNANLREEITNLKTQKEEYKSAYDLYQSSKATIENYEVMTGALPVSGSGALVTISRVPSLAELTDLLNELYQLGSEAVSLNGKRITNETSGLEAFNGQIVFDGRILSHPLEIKVIGESSAITKSLDRPDSTLYRLQKRSPDTKITITEGEITIPALD